MNIKKKIVKLQNKNIDLLEIKKFSAISSRWWDLSGEFKVLHRINVLRLDYILNRSSGIFGKKVLDVGCGGGILSESMAYEGAKVTGIDIEPKSLLIARTHALEKNIKIKYIHETVEEHAKTHKANYDIVTCMEILEHVPHPELIVRACSKLVKSGGMVFFSTFNRNFKSWIMAIIGAEYFLHIIPSGTHDFNKFIKPSELLNWLDNTSLKEQHIIGLHYNLIFDRFSLKKNVDVHYILHTCNL